MAGTRRALPLLVREGAFAVKVFRRAAGDVVLGVGSSECPRNDLECAPARFVYECGEEADRFA